MPRHNEGCIRLFHLPGFFLIFISIVFQITVFLFYVISLSNIQSMFQIGFVWQAMWIQSKLTAVIQKLSRKLPGNILVSSCCQ